MRNTNERSEDLEDSFKALCLPDIVKITVLIMHLFEHHKHTLVLVTVF